MHWFNCGGPSGYGFMGFGPIGMIIFWALFIAAIIYLVRKVGTARGTDRLERETPLEILNRRYAAGEISGQEYKEMKAEIAAKK